jgi:phosphoglycerol transferase MdoB-like AlkP superfamily enzyme
MLSLLLQHPWLAGVSLLLLVLLTYTGWIWWRQRVSKARFSLSIVGTLASLPVALLAFLSSSPLGSLINFANKKLGIDLPTLDDGPDFLQGMIALLRLSPRIIRFTGSREQH